MYELFQDFDHRCGMINLVVATDRPTSRPRRGDFQLSPAGPQRGACILAPTDCSDGLGFGSVTVCSLIVLLSHPAKLVAYLA
jgi:hypothetical protein